MASGLLLDSAARTLLAGGVIAYPTESVYGLGCLPLDYEAVTRILATKGRDAGKGLIIIAAEIAEIAAFVSVGEAKMRKEILASWPGPVTWVLPAHPFVPFWLTGGRNSLAVRITDHPLARYLCQRTGGSLISTSANRAGQSPLRSALAVRRQLGSEIDNVLVGPLGDSPRPTAIRDGTTGALLRAG